MCLCVCGALCLPRHARRVTPENRARRVQRQQCVSELIRLLSKDAGGSKHYTGRGRSGGGAAAANHGGKMFGLQRQETEPRRKNAKKKKCCSHWLAAREFMRAAMENGDGISREKKKSHILTETIENEKQPLLRWDC